MPLIQSPDNPFNKEGDDGVTGSCTEIARGNLVPDVRQPAPSPSQIGGIGGGFTTEARKSTTESPAWGPIDSGTPLRCGACAPSAVGIGGRRWGSTPNLQEDLARPTAFAVADSPDSACCGQFPVRSVIGCYNTCYNAMKTSCSGVRATTAPLAHFGPKSCITLYNSAALDRDWCELSDHAYHVDRRDPKGFYTFKFNSGRLSGLLLTRMK